MVKSIKLKVDGKNAGKEKEMEIKIEKEVNSSIN